MPAMIKCPNCHAPLREVPSGPGAKCPYCGVALVATRLMAAPPVPAPPILRAPFPVGVPPAGAADLDRQRRARRLILAIVLFTVVPGVLVPVVLVLTAASATRTTTTTVTTPGTVVVTTIGGDGGVVLRFGPGGSSGAPGPSARKPPPEHALPPVELRAGMLQPLTLRRGTESVAAKFHVETPGLYSLELTATDDLGLVLADGDGSELARRAAESDDHRATLVERLVAGDYVVQVRSGAPATANIPAKVMLTRVEPVQIELGRTVTGRLSPAAARAWFSVTLASPTPVRAKVVAPGFSPRLSLTHTGGSAAVSSPAADSGRPARLETDDALPAGTYRVEVSGRPATGAAGAFTVVVAARTPDPEPLEPAERDEYQRLHGCGCRMDVDGRPGGETLALAAQMLGRSFSVGDEEGAGVEYTMAYAVDLGEGTWLQLPVEEPSAPAGSVQGNALAIGVGCADGLMVVASESWVTGWSLEERKRAWNTALDGRYPPARPGEGGLGMDCKALRISRGVVRVPLEGGGTVGVRTADGSVVP